MATRLKSPEDHRRVVEGYLEKRQLYPFQVDSPVADELGLVVVIPSLAEPDLLDTLDSLARCQPPVAQVEVLVVVNHPDGAEDAVVEANRQSLSKANDWARSAPPFWKLHLLTYPDLPARTAGVGLARKLGLDEAASRLARSASGQGILVCLDADCTVAANYLLAIESHYADCADDGAATIEFEHPLAGPGDGLAIAQYELHLRYYVEALRWAGVPNVRHTVGSCMTLRSTVYAAQGGMNRRQAGEDYYFLQKLVAAVPVGEIRNTRVLPSPRRSWRVPFGTGRAVADNDGLALESYDPEIFSDLAGWIALAPQLHDPDRETALTRLPASMLQWLEDQDVRARLAEIRENTGSSAAFRHRLFRWFNAFRCLKFVHYATASGRPRIAVEKAAWRLLAWLDDIEGVEPQDAVSLLARYRKRQWLSPVVSSAPPGNRPRSGDAPEARARATAR